MLLNHGPTKLLLYILGSFNLEMYRNGDKNVKIPKLNSFVKKKKKKKKELFESSKEILEHD